MTEITPFFIVGCARSGTTMLRRVLDRHSQVCVPEETHFIPEVYPAFARYVRRGQLDNAANLLNQQPIIRRWGLNIESQKFTGEDTKAIYANAVSLLMTRKAKSHGKKYWGEKTPTYIHHIPFFVELFPQAKFIHIHRDGRDVALSVMPLKWGPNNAYAAARWWVKAIDAWRQAQPSLRGGGQKSVTRILSKTHRQDCSEFVIILTCPMKPGFWMVFVFMLAGLGDGRISFISRGKREKYSSL